MAPPLGQSVARGPGVITDDSHPWFSYRNTTWVNTTWDCFLAGHVAIGCVAGGVTLGCTTLELEFLNGLRGAGEVGA